MDRRKGSGMARIEQLQEIERFTPSDLSQQDSVRAMAERSLEQISNGDGLKPVLSLPRFEANQVGVGKMDLGCIFDKENPFGRRNESTKGIESRGFP